MKGIKYILLFTLIIAAFSCTKNDSAEMDVTGLDGKGGSMARITIVGDYMYAVDYSNLKVFDISNTENPILLDNIDLGFGIETIFPFKDNLFIGSESGMLIYDIATRSKPIYVSDFAHVMSCDPVVVNDSVAFVTLRSGGDCHFGTTANELNIIDIKNMENPQLIKTIPMNTPYGLAIDENLIFICHGGYGLGIYSYDNNYTLNQVNYIDNIKAFDVILDHKNALIIGDTGFRQYDYSNVNSLVLNDQISIGQ
jgi:hypothetical protein